MVVDIEKAMKEFIKYVEQYDTEEFQIKRKISHSIRVMEISNKIAKSLNLSEKQIEIATLIGLLHDIARFEQFTQYKTFKDSKSIDHGDFGVEILKKKNYIRKYIDTNEFDEIIYTAIKNHNKFETQKGLDSEQLLFCKIIRDADKLDILYQATCISWKGEKEQMEEETLEDIDLQPFLEKRLINRKNNQASKKKIRRLLATLAFMFDINYPITFQMLKEKDYINKCIDRFNFKDEKTRKIIVKIKNILNTYLEEKTNTPKG